MSVGLAGLANALLAMSKTAKQRAETYKRHHGETNTALVWTLHFILLAGAEACIQLAEERHGEG